MSISKLVVSFCVVGGALWGADAEAQSIAPGVVVIRGPVNGVVVTHGTGSLAIYGDPRHKAAPVQRVLFTDGRRDVVWAGRTLVRNGAQAVVPAGEAEWFSEPAQFWRQLQKSRFHDYAQQTTKRPVEALPVAQAVRGGDRIEWQGLTFQVVDTPGYTRGAVSYVFEAGGKRIACVGDLIYGDGQILDLYSLQDAVPAAKARGYHGYAARAGDLLASLRKVLALKPDLLVPAHGPVVDNPQRAVAKLGERLTQLFRSHFETDALRWYWGDENLRIRARGVLGDSAINWMPMSEQSKLPDWVVPIDNARLIVSKSGAALLVDCGSRRIADGVRKLRDEGRFRKLDGIWITHYHDDHTDFAQTASEEFQCPVLATRELRDILENPSAYRVPCLTMNPIRSLKIMPEGQTHRWNEFELTELFFPGQTLYHDGLLVKKDGGEGILFAGDSFTPSGVDDYCLLNRNFLGGGEGFLYCLAKVARMAPGTWIVNQHVEPMFRFNPKEVGLLTNALESRSGILKTLFPFDDPNYGTDEQWARFYPYGREVEKGSRVEWNVVIRNHSPQTREYVIAPHAPAGWQMDSGALHVTIPARQERSVSVRATAPREAGLSVLTADIAFGPWDLREWVETLVSVR